MAGLVPAILFAAATKDRRDKPGDDVRSRCQRTKRSRCASAIRVLAPPSTLIMAGLVPAILFAAATKDRRNKPGDDVRRTSMAMTANKIIIPFPQRKNPAFAGSSSQDTISEYSAFYHIERALSRTKF